jgi:hypothetical protein
MIHSLPIVPIVLACAVSSLLIISETAVYTSDNVAQVPKVACSITGSDSTPGKMISLNILCGEKTLSLKDPGMVLSYLSKLNGNDLICKENKPNLFDCVFPKRD